MLRFFLYLSLLLTLTTPSIADSKLTKKSVSALLNQMTNAVNAKNAPGLVSHFADNAKIILHINGRPMETNPKQYQGLLQQTWAAASSYEYKITNLKINLAKDGKSAQVTDTTHEKAVINGQKVSSQAEETITVELVGGKPKVTRLEGRPK